MELKLPTGSSRTKLSVMRDTEGAFVFAKAETMRLVAVVLRALGRKARACEVRAAGALRVRRVESTLTMRSAE